MLATRKSDQKFRQQMIENGKEHHVQRIDKSHEIIDKVEAIYSKNNNYERAINYLKKIDPYVFEELVLSVLERRKIKIQRNTSYSGDGGIDGIFHIKKGRVLIQCKRYSNYISHQDVRELAENVKNGKYYIGLFVHTGNTGKASTTLSHYYKNVIFLQDENLAKFVSGQLNIERFIEKEYDDLKTKPKPSKKELPTYTKKKKGFSLSLPTFGWKTKTALVTSAVAGLHFSGVAPIPFDSIWHFISNFPFAEIATRLKEMYGDK